ncbi:hypothetical protein [Halomonas sp. ND22Bw]|uniref:hypothetical protein n=1 Tax=Halomonas sp. ND22Bw TaxID=2054178 RepID=UPI0011B20CB9
MALAATPFTAENLSATRFFEVQQGFGYHAGWRHRGMVALVDLFQRRGGAGNKVCMRGRGDFCGVIFLTKFHPVFFKILILLILFSTFNMPLLNT